MSETIKPEVGSIGWTDLTVADAEKIRDFYGVVVGWKFQLVDMDGYSDFNMNLPASEKSVAGICHKRGVNAEFPSQWLIYITVTNVDASAALCLELGGKIIIAPRAMGGSSRYCVIQDPAGAVAALFQP